MHDVSFDVQPGEVVALVGESGSGKTTTSSAVLGLLPSGGRIERGAIRLSGTDIAGWSDRRLQGVRGARIGLHPAGPGVVAEPGAPDRRAGRRDVPHPRAARPARHPEPRARAARARRPRRPGAARPAVPARALGRHAPAGAHRDRRRPASPSWSSPTSRRARSTSPCSGASSTSSTSCAASAAPPCCSSPTTSASPPSAPSASSCMQHGRIVEQGADRRRCSTPRPRRTRGGCWRMPRGSPSSRSATRDRRLPARRGCCRGREPVRARGIRPHEVLLAGPGARAVPRGRRRVVPGAARHHARDRRRVGLGQDDDGAHRVAVRHARRGARRARRHGGHARSRGRRSASSGGGCSSSTRTRSRRSTRGRRSPRSSPSRCATSASATGGPAPRRRTG